MKMSNTSENVEYSALLVMEEVATGVYFYKNGVLMNRTRYIIDIGDRDFVYPLYDLKCTREDVFSKKDKVDVRRVILPVFTDFVERIKKVFKLQGLVISCINLSGLITAYTDMHTYLRGEFHIPVYFVPYEEIRLISMVYQDYDRCKCVCGKNEYMTVGRDNPKVMCVWCKAISDSPKGNIEKLIPWDRFEPVSPIDK